MAIVTRIPPVVEVRPARRPFDMEVAIPGDKSITHRAVLFGAIAEGETEIRNPLDADDTGRSLELARAIGARVARGSGVWKVAGIGGAGAAAGAARPDPVLIDCGNSGTTMRLGLGLLAGLPGAFTLTGDESLRSRPMARVVEPLRAMGAAIEGTDGGRRAPLTIRGGSLRAIEWSSPVASAQVKSALLLGGLRAEGRTSVTEPSASRDHSERMLAGFGVEVERQVGPDGRVRVTVNGGARLAGQVVEVPGDISSAAFFLVAAAIVPGSRVTIRGVGVNPTRTGILDVLRAAGVDVVKANERVACGEPLADVSVRGPERLRPFTVAGTLVPRLVDEVPVLAVLALAAEGVSQFRDCAELRVKETDRLAALARELGKLGAHVEERDDGLLVEGGRPLAGGRVASGGDHRLAMTLAIAALLAREPVTVEGFDAVSVSFPDFWAAINRLW